MEWSDSWRGAFRIELRAEAVSLAWRGWPVMPGTVPTGADEVPAPVHADWQDRVGSAKPEEVATWWAGNTHGLLLATGRGVDAIGVSADLGRRAATALRTIGVPVPIIATPSGRWMFLVASGQELRAELAAQDGVRLFAAGDHIPRPPTPFQHGVAHWRVKPQICGWNAPASDVVQDALVEAVHDQVLSGAQRLVAAESV